MRMASLYRGSSGIAWIRKGSDLGKKIELQETGVQLDDFPICWSQWFDIDGVRDWWV